MRMKKEYEKWTNIIKKRTSDPIRKIYYIKYSGCDPLLLCIVGVKNVRLIKSNQIKSHFTVIPWNRSVSVSVYPKQTFFIAGKVNPSPLAFCIWRSMNKFCIFAQSFRSKWLKWPNETYGKHLFSTQTHIYIFGIWEEHMHWILRKRDTIFIYWNVVHFKLY